MNKTNKLWILFSSTFAISALTSGGYVIVSMMRKKFVDQLHWLEEDEMLDLTSIAQSTQGPVAVNASILVGYRISGLRGALITIPVSYTHLTAKRLYDEGVYVNNVLPPATPEHECLLRTSYMATHTETLLEEALDIIERVLKENV